MKPTYQQRILAIPGYIRGPIILLLLIPGIALAVFWWVNYAGLYRILVEWQSNTFGGYLPVYTGIFTIAILGIIPPALALFVIVQLNLFPVDPNNPPPVPTGGAAADVWIQEHRGRLIGLIAGLMGVIAGPILLYVASTDALQPLDVAALEAGQKPPSSYVVARGRLLYDRMVTQKESGLDKWFVPLVSPNWKEGMPIRLYVSIPQLRREEAAKGDLKGMLSENGLPGPIRVSFEQSGRARPSQPHYYLAFGRVPETMRDAGWFFLISGAVVLALTALVWVIKARRGMA